MLDKNQKVATMMPHQTKTITVAICTAEQLGLTSKASQEKPKPKSDFRTWKKKHLVKSLDLTPVIEGYEERLRRILRNLITCKMKILEK